MEDADRANEVVLDADDVRVAEPAQHQDDETDSHEEDEGADDDNSSEEAEEEEPIPTPEEVELEYTFPQDFVGRSWEDVVQGRYCRLIIDPSCTNMTVIPSRCFQGCYSLVDIVIPGTVRTIQSLAFADCLALSVVDLPESVIAIGEEAYQNCSVLARVTIRPSTNAVQVGRNASGRCLSLSTIKVYPWQFPTIFAAMNDDPSFIYKFFHQYHHQILDEEAEVGMVTRQHRNGRRRQRQRSPQKNQRLQR